MGPKRDQNRSQKRSQQKKSLLLQQFLPYGFFQQFRICLDLYSLNEDSSAQDLGRHFHEQDLMAAFGFFLIFFSMTAVTIHNTYFVQTRTSSRILAIVLSLIDYPFFHFFHDDWSRQPHRRKMGLFYCPLWYHHPRLEGLYRLCPKCRRGGQYRIPKSVSCVCAIGLVLRHWFRRLRRHRLLPSTQSFRCPPLVDLYHRSMQHYVFVLLYLSQS